MQKNVAEDLNIEYIVNRIFEDIYNDAFQSKKCKKCGSVNIALIDDTNATYKCHDCKHSYSQKADSLYQKVRLTNDKWNKFLTAMISDYTLEETVKFVQINAEVVKRKWDYIYQNVNWDKYNVLVREKPTKNIYADFDIIFS